MDLGEVMFWKAVVVALLVLAGERWYAFKRNRAANGILLKKQKDGVYRPDDWPDTLERRAVKTYWWGLFGFYVGAAFVIGTLYLGYWY